MYKDTRVRLVQHYIIVKVIPLVREKCQSRNLSACMVSTRAKCRSYFDAFPDFADLEPGPYLWSRSFLSFAAFCA